MNDPEIKVAITGGHLTPAIALMENLSAKGYRLYYFGRKYAAEGNKSPSLESVYAQRYGAKYIFFDSGRLSRYITLFQLVSVYKLIKGFILSFYHLSRMRPHIIVSFGGYLSLPICLSAKLMGIPFIIHEQTSVFGLANRILGNQATRICLSYEKTGLLPANLPVALTGIPLRQSIVSPRPFTIKGKRNKKLIFITGGSQGSRFINHLMLQVVPELLCRFRIIHQFGQNQSSADWEKIQNLVNLLPDDLKEDYTVEKVIDPGKIGSYIKNSDLVIGRAGANTTAEIAYFSKKAIFFPLPWSADGEQLSNAGLMEKYGLVKIFLQHEVTAGQLLTAIDELMKKSPSDKFKTFLRFDPLAANLAAAVEAVVNK